MNRIISLVCFLMVSVLMACGDWLDAGERYNRFAAEIQDIRSFTEGEPLVLSIYPNETSSDVQPETPVTITFSVPMDQASAVAAVTLTEPGDFTWGPSDQTLVFAPSQPWARGQSFGVDIAPGAESKLGQPSTVPYSATFTIATEADTTPPRILGVSPTIGSSAVTDLENVPIGIYVALRFSEAMEQAATNAAFQLIDGNFAQVEGSQEWLAPDFVVFRPASPLQLDTRYAIQLSTGAQDLSGINLETALNRPFKTTADAETVPPTVIATQPVDGARDVPVRNQINIQFSEQMNIGRTQGSVELTSPEGPVSGHFSWLADTLVFVPSEPLQVETFYAITIATTAEDVSGNALAEEFTAVFETADTDAPDTTPPTVVEIQPVDGATGVPGNTPISVTFSEPVQLASAAAGVTLREEQLITLSLVGGTGRELTFSFDQPLRPGAEHQIDVTTSIKDLAGNALALAQDATFGVSTDPIDVTAPGPVIDLAALPAKTQVELSWTDPADFDFDKVVIRRALFAAPATASDGDLVCDPCTSPHTDSGLTPTTEYFYSAFAVDVATNASAARSVSVTTLLLAEVGVRRSSEAQADDLFGISVSISGDRAIVGVRLEDGGPGDPVTGAGAAVVFERDGTGAWNEVQILRASDRQQGDLFGHPVSIDGDRAMVGAHGEGGGIGDPASDSGAVYLFERDGAGTWNEAQILRASDGQVADHFGLAVSLNGDRAIVGARLEDGGSGDTTSNFGAAYLFERNGAGVWNEIQILRASDAQPGDRFGGSVSISGDYAIVGVAREDGGAGDLAPDSGAAVVFERDGTGIWNEVQILRASDGQPDDRFGGSMSISGDHAIIGALFEDGGAGDPAIDSGAAYVFERNGLGIWNEVQILRASESQADSNFGNAVAMSGDRAIVGARLENGRPGDIGFNFGAAYVFERDGADIWNEIQALRASDGQPSDQFGTSVSISGDRAIVGAMWEDGGLGNPAMDSGAVYFFE